MSESRPEWDAVRAADDCDQLRAQVEAMRPVIEAARAVAGMWRLIDRTVLAGNQRRSAPTMALLAAVATFDAAARRPVLDAPGLRRVGAGEATSETSPMPQGGSGTAPS